VERGGVDAKMIKELKGLKVTFQGVQGTAKDGFERTIKGIDTEVKVANKEFRIKGTNPPRTENVLVNMERSKYLPLMFFIDRH
jgi:hypothetical protein